MCTLTILIRTSSVFKIYIAETAPSNLRGGLGAVNQLAVGTGILMSYVVGHVLNWRSSALVGIASPAFIVILMFFMPETARWLLAHDKEERALKVLRWLRGPHADIDSELQEVVSSLRE